MTPPADQIDEVALLGTPWRYGHDGRVPSTDCFRLLPDGGIGGYDHPNERGWRIDDGVLALLAADGSCTVRFDAVAVEHGRQVLRGRYLRDPAAGITLRLEQASAEAAIAPETVKTILSPGFSIAPPLLRNGHLIPPGVQATLTPIWQSGSFPAMPIQFSVLREAIIAKEGLVFTADLALVPASITQHSPAEIDWARSAAAAALTEGSLPRIDGTAVLCKKRGVGNYGHWLLEMFPKAVLATQHLAFAEMRFIVPDASGALRDTILATLRRIGVVGARCLPRGDAPVRVERLVMVDGMTTHGSYMSPLAVAAVEPLSWDVLAGSDRLLYLSRGSAGHRRFRNEADVAAIARAAGYRIFDPGTAALHEQIAVFAGARHIVGILGAALTNTVFAPPTAAVTVLAPANMPDTFFWFIAGLRGQSYEEVRCELEGPIRGVADWDRDMIFPEDLAATIFRPPTPPPPPSPSPATG